MCYHNPWCNQRVTWWRNNPFNRCSALVDLSNFGYTPASIFILAPGAFFVLAMCVAVMNRVKRKHGMKPAEVPDYVSDEEKEN